MTTVIDITMKKRANRTASNKGKPKEVSIHPQVIEKEGKKEFVVLPYEEFLVIKELLEDFEDLKDLREAKADSGDKSTVKLSEIKKDLLKD